MARILVVDDQEEVAELVQAMLTDAGHAVEAVYSGQVALDRLKRTVYDLVVCDVRMPDVDGRAVFHAVGQLMPPRPIVLFMTGYGDSPTESEFLQTTGAVVLAKPLGIDELLARHPGLAGDAGDDDRDVTAGGLLISVAADDRHVRAADGCRLLEVEGLAHRHLLDDVYQHQVGDFLSGQPVRGGMPNHPCADNRDLRTAAHVAPYPMLSMTALAKSLVRTSFAPSISLARS